MFSPINPNIWDTARKNDLEDLNFYVNTRKIDVNSHHFGGSTPLIIACENNCKAVVRALLIQPTIDINLPTTVKGVTPLIAACFYGHLELVSLLLADARIDPNKPNASETTPRGIACGVGDEDVVSRYRPILGLTLISQISSSAHLCTKQPKMGTFLLWNCCLRLLAALTPCLEGVTETLLSMSDFFFGQSKTAVHVGGELL